ncbi:unnamed protein product [Haemonchus placei]|uniref:Uncharacterized protein n=1 Tax=Haemonchus placei TaxID=6290 RepID=A0A0N4X877_HAEPC|nr:unnamed protein product [Haemonchus placei]
MEADLLAVETYAQDRRRIARDPYAIIALRHSHNTITIVVTVFANEALGSTSLGGASSLPHPSECTPFEMRGPPPAWMPPHPPDRDHDYENNYEDPEDCRERGKVG